MVQVLGSDSTYEPMDFLWVRWYGLDTSAGSGFKARRLHQLGFPDSNEKAGTFGFIDPHDVIRPVHLIPAFHFGRTFLLLSPSMARREDENHEDYEQYYVHMYAFHPICRKMCELTIYNYRIIDRDTYLLAIMWTLAGLQSFTWHNEGVPRG